MKHLGVGYNDVLMMPVYERKMFITFLKEDFEKEEEQYEKMTNSSGKPKTHLTGDAVKNFAMNNE